jgi:MFS transporter, DHA2 family, multidrug resistance protein
METLETSATAPRAGRREWLGLAVIALPCLLYSMDLTVLLLAVPHLSAELRPSGATLLWIVDIYGFLIAGSLITMGTLGDRIGRRKLLMIGALAFGAASVLAAFSTSAAMLVVARALQGIAGATLAPSTLALIRNMFHDREQRTVAIGVWIASFSAGGAIGPLIGGALLSQHWWGSVFLINVPVMLLLLTVGPRLLPEFRDGSAGRLDLVSAAMSVASVISAIYGIKRVAEAGMSWLAAGALGTGVMLAALFMRRQRRAEPLIDVRLFRSTAFCGALSVNLLGFFIAFGSFFFVAQYLQLVLGLEPFRAGLWTSSSAVGFIAGSQGAPVLARHLGATRVMAGGLTLAAAGFGLLTQVGASNGLGVLVSGYVVLSIGLAPVFTLATDVVVASAPPQQAGAASAIAETSSELGGAIGIAILGSIVSASYRGAMGDSVPDGVPREAAEAARQTLAAALDAARALPDALAADLLARSRAAFVDAFRLAAGISGLLALIGGIAVMLFLRRLSPAPAPEPTL